MQQATTDEAAVAADDVFVAPDESGNSKKVLFQELLLLPVPLLLIRSKRMGFWP